MILESRRYVVLAGYRRRSLLPAPCDAYLIKGGEIITTITVLICEAMWRTLLWLTLLVDILSLSRWSWRLGIVCEIQLIKIRAEKYRSIRNHKTLPTKSRVIIWVRLPVIPQKFSMHHLKGFCCTLTYNVNISRPTRCTNFWTPCISTILGKMRLNYHSERSELRYGVRGLDFGVVR